MPGFRNPFTQENCSKDPNIRAFLPTVQDTATWRSQSALLKRLPFFSPVICQEDKLQEAIEKEYGAISKVLDRVKVSTYSIFSRFCRPAMHDRQQPDASQRLKR